MTQPIRVGLIGLGNMGRNHLRVLSLLKGVDIAALHDADTAKLQEIAAAQSLYAASDLDAFFKTPMDAVVVASPTSTHADVYKRIPDAIKHVFIEKPMAGSLEDAEDIAMHAATIGRHVQVGYIERFNPAAQQLKRVINASDGLVSIDLTRTNKLSARISDVDVVTDLMIHDIDLALHIAGPVKAVSAYGIIQNGLVALASATLVHTGGSFSRIQASRMTEKKIRRIEATCHDLYVDCDLTRKEVILHRQSQIMHKGGEYTINAQHEEIEVRAQEPLLLEVQNFIENCRGFDVPVPSARDDVAAMRICQDIQKQIYT